MAQHLEVVSQKNLSYFTSSLIATSLVLMASLAWNSFFQALFDKVIPSKKWEIIGHLAYAFILTGVVYYALKAYVKLNTKVVPTEKKSFQTAPVETKCDSSQVTRS